MEYSPEQFAAPEPENQGGIGHNTGQSVETLKTFVERIEFIDEEIRALNASKSDVYAEAKGTGFEVAAIKWAIKERRIDPEKRNERDNVRELYARALGMAV